MLINKQPFWKIIKSNKQLPQIFKTTLIAPCHTKTQWNSTKTKEMEKLSAVFGHKGKVGNSGRAKKTLKP